MNIGSRKDDDAPTRPSLHKDGWIHTSLSKSFAGIGNEKGKILVYILIKNNWPKRLQESDERSEEGAFFPLIIESIQRGNRFMLRQYLGERRESKGEELSEGERWITEEKDKSRG